MNLILFGIQGSGKGTQAKILAERFNLAICEAGSQLRAIASQDSELGKKVKSLIEAGKLVPDEIIIEIVKNFIEKTEPGKNILFDGIPRRDIQKVALNELLKKTDREYIAIFIDVPEEEVLKRLISRGRNDDNELSIKTRLKSYFDETLPLIKEYENLGKLIRVNGFQNIEKVAEEISNSISKYYV